MIVCFEEHRMLHAVEKLSLGAGKLRFVLSVDGELMACPVFDVDFDHGPLRSPIALLHSLSLFQAPESSNQSAKASPPLHQATT